jgi:hypothetical protein
MPIYFLLHDARRFHDQVIPALAAAWSKRSFTPCRVLCTDLLAGVATFAERYHTGKLDSVVEQASLGLPFDPIYWHALAGEALLYGAVEIPELQVAPDTLSALVEPSSCPADSLSRQHFTAIQQAHWGARDLVFGRAIYRPEHAGYNDATDVARLYAYLAAVDPARWRSSDLAHLGDDAEREEELEFARDWFPALRDLYREADRHGQVVVCEIL